MAGVEFSDQFFVPGYVLYDPRFSKSLAKSALPKPYQNRPLQILSINSRPAELIANIGKAVEEVTAHAPVFKMVALGEVDKVRAQGDYDIYAGALPVGDENVEGALGYIFGLNPPIIPNCGTEAKYDFARRVNEVRFLQNLTQRYAEYRNVFADAINNGCILPLFHFSTLVIAKEGLDLSAVPSTDETAAFSKVRIK